MTAQGLPRPPARGTRLRLALVESLRGYTLQGFVHDATAGLIVGVIALPLAIAFAIATLGDAATNAPQVGLVTVIVAGTVAALLGGSRVLVTGPTGAFIVVLAGVVHRHGFDGLLLATILAGVLLVLAGLFRLGQVIKFIPYPVTVGFTAGIAVVIFAGQLPDLFGAPLYHAPPEALAKTWLVLQHIADGFWNKSALLVALGTIAVIQLTQRFVPRLPGPVVALVMFTALVHATGLDVTTVGDKYTIPSGLSAPRAPDFSWADVKAVMPDAITIAILGAIESLLAAVVADGMIRTRHDSNQELIAQGFANIASPFFGGIAATGAIARTAANIQGGGRTPVAALVHVLVVVAVLFFLAPYAMLIPMPVLAGLLAVVAWNMSERRHFGRILKMPRADAAVMVATFMLTIAVDLTVAVTVGLLLSAAMFMHRMAESTRIASVDPRADPELSLGQLGPDDIPDGVMVYSIDGPFFFGAADRFRDTMGFIAQAPKVMVLRLRNVPYLDATAFNALESVVLGLQRRGVRVMLASIQSQPLEMLQRARFMPVVGDGNVFRHTKDALQEARRMLTPATESS